MSVQDLGRSVRSFWPSLCKALYLLVPLQALLDYSYTGLAHTRICRAVSSDVGPQVNLKPNYTGRGWGSGLLPGVLLCKVHMYRCCCARVHMHRRC